MKLRLSLLITLFHLVSVGQKGSILESQTFKRGGGDVKTRHTTIFNLKNKLLLCNEIGKKLTWQSFTEDLTIENSNKLNLKRTKSRLKYYDGIPDKQMVYFFKTNNILYQYKIDENKKGSTVLISRVQQSTNNENFEVLSKLPTLHRHKVIVSGNYLVLTQEKLRKKGFFGAEVTDQTTIIFDDNLDEIYKGKLAIKEIHAISEQDNSLILMGYDIDTNIAYSRLSNGNEKLIDFPFETRRINWIPSKKGLKIYTLDNNQLKIHELVGNNWKTTEVKNTLQDTIIEPSPNYKVALKSEVIKIEEHNEKLYFFLERSGNITYRSGDSYKTVHHSHDAQVIEVTEGISTWEFKILKHQACANWIGINPSIYPTFYNNHINILYYDNFKNKDNQRLICKGNDNKNNAIFNLDLNLERKTKKKKVILTTKSLKRNVRPQLHRGMLLKNSLIIPNVLNTKYSLTKILLQ
jgi:hypothetical protein